MRVAVVCGNLCSLLAESGRFEEAVAMADRALAIRTRVFGPEHATTLQALNNRAITLQQWGRTDESLAAFDDLLARARRNPAIDALTRAMFERSCVLVYSESRRDEPGLVRLDEFWPRAVAQWGAEATVVRELAEAGLAMARRLGRRAEVERWAERAGRERKR